MLDSLATTDLSKVGMNHAAIITSPKPMSAEARNTAARGSTKKSLADSRDATKKQLWQPSVNTPKYVRSARQGEKAPKYVDDDSCDDVDNEDLYITVESPVHVPSEKKAKANGKTPTFPPCKPNVGGRRALPGHTSHDLDSGYGSATHASHPGIKQHLPRAFPEVAHTIHQPQPPVVVPEAPPSFTSEQQMQQRVSKMFDDMFKKRLNEVMPQLELATEMPPPAPTEQQLVEHRQRRYSVDQPPGFSSRITDGYATTPDHFLDQPLLQPFDRFSTGRQQMVSMSTNPPAFDSVSVVSAMVNNFANARNLDRLQRNVDDLRQREDQYRERELLDRMSQEMLAKFGSYHG